MSKSDGNHDPAYVPCNWKPWGSFPILKNGRQLPRRHVASAGLLPDSLHWVVFLCICSLTEVATCSAWTCHGPQLGPQKGTLSLHHSLLDDCTGAQAHTMLIQGILYLSHSVASWIVVPESPACSTSYGHLGAGVSCLVSSDTRCVWSGWAACQERLFTCTAICMHKHPQGGGVLCSVPSGTPGAWSGWGACQLQPPSCTWLGALPCLSWPWRDVPRWIPCMWCQHRGWKVDARRDVQWWTPAHGVNTHGWLEDVMRNIQWCALADGVSFMIKSIVLYSAIEDPHTARYSNPDPCWFDLAVDEVMMSVLQCCWWCTAGGGAGVCAALRAEELSCHPAPTHPAFALLVVVQ
eukprot:1155061-Pelagomonas_calceolata.AAC.5